MRRHGLIVRPYGDIAATFNPGLTLHDGAYRLLVRAVPKGYEKIGDVNEFDDNYTSHLSLWEGDTPTAFTRIMEDAIAPGDGFDRYGVEDPRITRIGDTCYICYTALAIGLGRPDASDGIRIAMASTKDFRSFKKHGIIGPDLRSKAGTLFESEGKLYLLWKDEHVVERTMLSTVPADYENPAAWADFWHDPGILHHQLLGPQQNDHEGRGVEPGAPPIRIKEGLLLVYSSISLDFRWTISALLLDAFDPARILAKTMAPLLVPETDYERHGDVHNVAFPCGAVIADEVLYVTYGAADSVCAVASLPMPDLRAALRPYAGAQPAAQRLPLHQANDDAFL